jgi:hypothetical protein
MTPLSNCWKWIASHVVVHRRRSTAVVGPHRHRLFHHWLVRRPRVGRFVWTCSAVPVFAIPPAAFWWHPFIAPGPVAAIAPPSDTGGYGGFDSGGSELGYGAGLPSGIGVELIPSAFAGSPSFLNTPPSLTGTSSCVSDCGSSVPGMSGAAVSEPNGCIIMAALLVIFAILARRQSLHARLNAPAETRTGSGARKP